MSSLFCPIKSSDEFKEMLRVFGPDNEAYVYYLWNKNKGNPLDLDPNGKKSILFEEILELTNGDRDKALKIKSLAYNKAFISYFGDWIEGNYQPDTHEVYENGEPTVYNLTTRDYSRESEKLTHADPLVREAISKYGDALINDGNNPYTWKIEKELGLLDDIPFTKKPGEKFATKNLKAFTYPKALRLVKEVEKLGGTAALVTKIHNGKVFYSVKVFYKIGRPLNVISAAKKTQAEASASTSKEYNKLKEMLSDIESKQYNSTALLNYVRKRHYASLKNQHVKDMFDLIIASRHKMNLPNVVVVDIPVSEYNYMEYDPNTHTIKLYKNDILSVGKVDAMVIGLIHEFWHGYLYNSLEKPTTAAEKAFRDDMLLVYNTLKKSSAGKALIDKGYKYEMEDIHEFLSYFLSSPRFSDELKNIRNPLKNKTFFSQILDFISSLILSVTGYSIRKEKGDNLYSYIRSTVENYVSNSNKLSVYSSKTEKLALTKKVTRGSIYTDIKNSIDKNKPETIKTALSNLKSLFDIRLTDEEHLYVEKESNTAFKPVTTLMKEAGYGINESKLSEAGLEKLRRASKIGKTIHIGFESAVKNVSNDIFEETGFILNDDAQGMLKKIIEDIKKSKTPRNGSIEVLSEVFVADPEKQIAGTIDLVLIDNVGRVYLFDFKTKENGWAYYKSTKFGPSSQESYKLQLGIYKHILEKTLNIPVYGMGVVLLKPTITKSEVDGKTIETIGSISIDTTFFDNGIDFFRKETTTVNKVYNEKPKIFSLSSIESDILDDPKYTESIEYKLKKINSEKLTDLEKIYNDTIRILSDKLEIIRKRYSSSKSKSFEEFVTETLQESSPSAAILAVLKYASNVSNQLLSLYFKMQKNGEIITPKMLMEWSDYISTFDILDRLATLLKENPNLLNDPTALDILSGKNGLLITKNAIRDIIEREGKLSIARRLAPYYNGLKMRRKEELQRKYRRLEYRYKNNTKGTGKVRSDVYNTDEDLTPEELDIFLKNITEEEYININLKKEMDALDKLTFEMLYKELSIASSDINDLARWLETLEDSSDMVVSSMLSLYNEADEKARIQGLEKRLEVLRITREVEQYFGKSSFGSEEKFWSDILERIDGNLTNQLIRPWLSTLDDEERAVRAANKSKTEEKAREDMKAWFDFNFKIETHFDEYVDAFAEHLEKAVKEGKITKAEKFALLDNMTAVKPRPISSLATYTPATREHDEIEAVISDDAADIALTWVAKNRRLYADINEKWLNPQWIAFMRKVGIDTKLPIAKQMDALRASSNPMAKAYILFVDLANSADACLPYNGRLGYALPGIAKNKDERLRSGQGAVELAKGALSLGFLARADDTHVQREEFTDEKGNPKYFLPRHFTAKLTPEEQSFDLFTIYFKYWDMANHFLAKREVLPELELTKHFVQTRKTERRDSLGNKIVKMVRSDRPITESDVSLNNTSKLAEQLEDWFQMYVYGNQVKKSDFKVGNYIVDGQKLVQKINSYTSLNLLALNLVQGIANVSIGEVMTQIEAIAGEWVSKKDLAKGTFVYSKWLPGMLGDIGSRAPQHVGSLLVERFDALDEDAASETNFANRTRVKALCKMSSFSFLQTSGEHLLRVRMLFSLLSNKRAIDDNGKDIGSMIDFYYSENGELKIKKEVNLKNSNWTEEDQLRFYRKFHGILYTLHGAYGTREKVAAQRYMIGQLAYLFRKFVLPGLRRRWSKARYVERMEQTMEGNYITTGRFFMNLAKDLKSFHFSVIGENWATLTDHERANIKRAMSEVAYLAAVVILANFAYTKWDEEDDPDDERYWALLAYQMYRLKAELLFYTPKLDEAFSLLRSPMASTSQLENLIKLTSQLFNPSEEYVKGPWKGHLKLEKDVIQMVPMYKQYYKIRDIEEQIQWFR